MIELAQSCMHASGVTDCKQRQDKTNMSSKRGPVVDSSVLRGRRAAACVVKEKLWKCRQVLKVYFMNSEVLEGWKCEGKEMNTEMIMKWAGAWEQAPSAPQFTVTERVDRADLRVKFSGSYSSH